MIQTYEAPQPGGKGRSGLKELEAPASLVVEVGDQRTSIICLSLFIPSSAVVSLSQQSSSSARTSSGIVRGAGVGVVGRMVG